MVASCLLIYLILAAFLALSPSLGLSDTSLKHSHSVRVQVGDPLYELNFLNSSLWDQNTWTYSTTFSWTALADDLTALLVFDGIKMGSKIYMDGAYLRDSLCACAHSLAQLANCSLFVVKSEFILVICSVLVVTMCTIPHANLPCYLLTPLPLFLCVSQRHPLPLCLSLSVATGTASGYPCFLTDIHCLYFSVSQ